MEDYRPEDSAFGHTNEVSPGAFADDIPLKVYTPPEATGGGDTITPGGNAETSFSTGNVDAYGKPMIFPDTPHITPSTRPGDNIGNLRHELNDTELDDAKKKRGK